MRRRINTLLQAFISHKRESYTEPSRSGTPKGEPIGLSKQKHYAALLMMLNIPQEEIAKQAGVSYGLLRKWNTEPLFKATVEQHFMDFAAYFFKHVQQRDQQQAAAYAQFMNESDKDMLKSPFPRQSYDVFSDAKQYSPRLITAIYEMIMTYSQGKDRTHHLSLLVAFLTIVKNCSGAEELAKAFQTSGIDLTTILGSSQKTLINAIKDTLSKNTITDKERKEALLNVFLLEGLL